MHDKYGVAQDKYCYPDSDVLINLLDIREPGILDQAEAELEPMAPLNSLYLSFHLSI